MQAGARLPPIVTRVAHAGHDDHRFCGFLLFEELAGREPCAGLLALSILGRRLPPEECAVLDDLAAVTSVADPRIWPLKLTRLVAEFGSAQTAVAAGNLSLEGAIIGPWVCEDAATLLLQIGADVGDRVDDEEVVRRALLDRIGVSHPPGWGVPFREADERLAALRICLERRGRTGLRAWSLLEACTRVLRRERKLEPNITLGVAAACLDLGAPPNSIGILMTVLVQTVFVANAVEAARQAPTVLRRLPDHVISYVGKPPRTSPRAQAAARAGQTSTR